MASHGGNTLYVSDLDGTLLRSEKRISEYTATVLNRLCEEGMIFSLATARSFYTATQVTEGFTARIPTVNYNGSFIFENRTGRMLYSNAFPREDAEWLLDTLRAGGVSPVVYSLQNGRDLFSYCSCEMSRGVKAFCDIHAGDPRANPVSDPSMLSNGEIFYLVCADEPEKLYPLYQKLRERFRCLYERERYTGEQWLELLPKNVSKAGALLTLKEMLQCERIVCFGDGKNDIEMFRIADECYAMANAVPELKEIATATIGSNDEDGVARWLADHFL